MLHAGKASLMQRRLPPEMNVLQASNLAHPCIDKAIGNNIVMQENTNVIFSHRRRTWLANPL